MELSSREVDSTSHACDQLCHISGTPPSSHLWLMSWSLVALRIAPELRGSGLACYGTCPLDRAALQELRALMLYDS